MKNMTKLIGALALMLAAVSANAQSATRVTVPFEFTVAGQILPPGDYRVSVNEAGNLVRLSGHGIRPVVFLTSQGDRFQDERNVLRFQSHGDGEWMLRTSRFCRIGTCVACAKIEGKRNGRRPIVESRHHRTFGRGIRQTHIVKRGGELT